MRPFPHVRRVLADAIEARVFPGAVVEVGRASGATATIAEGRQAYDAAAAHVDATTVYDLASLTKVLATTVFAVEGMMTGAWQPTDPVGRFVPTWRGEWRAGVTLQDLLEHCSGLPAHRPYYRTLRGRAAFEQAICAEPQDYPTRTQALYSDPGFMLLGCAVERALGQPLDHLFDQWRDRAVPGAAIGFGVPVHWLARTAPTEHFPSGQERRGTVHDENAEALGGVAGHAGLFGTAAAVGACARWWMQQTELLRLAARRSLVPGSSRAWGWDTMLPTSSCGARLSPQAIGHTGFTGTSLWIDPAQDLYVALLSNRVHPTREGDGIQPARRAVHDAVVEDLGSGL